MAAAEILCGVIAVVAGVVIAIAKLNFVRGIVTGHWGRLFSATLGLALLVVGGRTSSRYGMTAC